MKGKSSAKSRPRSITDYLDAQHLFDAQVAKSIIEAVGKVPEIDLDAIPEHLQSANPDKLASLALSWHLTELAKLYRWNERRQNLPDKKEIARRARKIGDLCRQLSDQLLENDGTIIDGIGPGYLFAFAAVDGEDEGASRVQAIADDIKRLKRWALASADRADAQNTVKPPRGRKPDLAFHDLLNKLGGVYFYIWKERPGRSVNPLTGNESGPYFRFAKAVIQILLPEWASENQIDGALGAAIERRSWPRIWEK